MYICVFLIYRWIYGDGPRGSLNETREHVSFWVIAYFRRQPWNGTIKFSKSNLDLDSFLLASSRSSSVSNTFFALVSI